MVRLLDPEPLEQVRVDLVRRMRLAGVRRPVDRRNPHQPHQAPHTVVAHPQPPYAGDARSGATRRTGTSETARRSGASGPESPHSRPSGGSTAKSARGRADGTAGRGSTPPRASPSACARAGSMSEPPRQEIPLDSQLPDLRVQGPDLLLVVLPLLRTGREGLLHPLIAFLFQLLT